MRDAIGGLVNIVIVVVFLVIVSGYLAFNVNYTKAFRVKNKIITTIEQYEGNCDVNSKCDLVIKDYMSAIGYSKNNGLKCKQINNAKLMQSTGYCVYKHNASISGEREYADKYYYEVVTQITLDIPIINKVMAGMNVFQVTGQTKTFTVKVK